MSGLPEPQQEVAPPRIVDVVLAGRKDRALRRSGLAALVAVAAHLALLAWAMAATVSLEDWSAKLAMRVHREVGEERVVEITPPPPPPPPPKARPPPKPKEIAPDAPPPAQAGQIIAQKEQPGAPLDLTGNTFVTGTARAYAGGVTSATGTNPHAVESPPEPDRSRPVGLAEEDWTCPWPPEAEAQQIDEQVAIVRVVVRSDGTVESAGIVRDPGSGFGSAAVACAMRERFTPAADRHGRPILAESTVRVRFTR